MRCVVVEGMMQCALYGWTSPRVHCLVCADRLRSVLGAMARVAWRCVVCLLYFCPNSFYTIVRCCPYDGGKECWKVALCGAIHPVDTDQLSKGTLAPHAANGGRKKTPSGIYAYLAGDAAVAA